MSDEKLQCGIVMPISAIDGCNEAHWADVLEIINDAIDEAGFDGELVSNADDVGIIHKRIIQNLYENPMVVCDVSGKNERQIERLFSKYIGLSPKFYSRIIRFSHIFELMRSKDNSWGDLVYKSGFYDQSHFIKNFKEFTGEDPSSYGFEEKNMANFHLKKT